MKTLTKNLFKDLLSSENRMDLFRDVENKLKNCTSLHPDIDFIFKKIYFPNKKYYIPLIYSMKKRENAPFLFAFGAQHNEYNGTWGILEFLHKSKLTHLENWINKTQGGCCFIPITNPYGFTLPSEKNKWGYYINSNVTEFGRAQTKKNVNINRFWVKTIEKNISLKKNYATPKINNILGDFIFNTCLKPSNPNSYTPLIIMDFHETSLVYRYLKDIEKNYSIEYESKHWIQRWILNSMINSLKEKSIKENKDLKKDEIYDLIKDTILKHNQQIEKNTFYFFSTASQSNELARYVDDKIYPKFKNNLYSLGPRDLIMPYPIKGCFMCASDKFKWVEGLSVEMRKIVFNLRKERRLCNESPNYFNNLYQIMEKNVEISSSIIENMFGYYTVKEKNQ